MHRRSRQKGSSQHRRQPGAEVVTPLIPLQKEVQPSIPVQEVVQPLIPLQLPSPRAKLQHELSHPTATLPNQTGAAHPPLATKLSRRLLSNGLDTVTTTVTDAAVVVVDGGGHTIAIASITDMPAGPVTVSLPFTTFTIDPRASDTGKVSVSVGVAPTPIPGSGPAPSFAPAISVNPAPVPVSTPSIQPASVQLASSTFLTSSVVMPAPSQTGNDNLGQSNTPSTTTTTPTTTASPTSTTSITAPSSSSNVPTTLATLVSSTSSTGLSFSTSSGLASSFSSSPSASSSDKSSSSSSTSSSPSLSTSSSGTSAISSATPSLTSSTSAATTTAAAAAAATSGGGSSVNVPVVGGVVGGLAGLALILGLLLLLMRWWRKRRSGSMMLRSIDDEIAPPGTSHSNAPMTQNPVANTSGTGAAIGAAAAGTGIGAMIKRMTGGSTATSDTSPSEKGFQNFGGRKLESVLLSGGDGYGGPSAPGTQTPSSFYRGWAERFPYDTPSQHSSMIVGPATPYRRPSSSIAELSSSRPDSDTLKAMPNSPHPAASLGWPLINTSAGRPVGSSGTSETSDLMLPLPGPRSIDGLGRSRPSQDGSRNSKFTEGF
ncbi:MAG: hypothetical protein GOMPHAMPRED_004613 [Gomphillus americanus]|uniref:Uncharacterized protein n=1 Tax=Gomphillus americanus TaxID=1940652 RepID=A0A8H3FP58_9LECA|nr:MAG: hypothetical protein GOMPHAMPRED_004613 [Gomphillus americanus]